MLGELCIQGRSPMPDDRFSSSSTAIFAWDLSSVQPFLSGIEVQRDNVAKRLGRGRCTLQRLFPEASCALQVRYHDWKRQAARQAREALESEVERLVLDLHTRGIYPSYDRVGSLLPAGMQGGYIVGIVRHNREMLGIPKHHGAIS
jgi:hypothetical protein